MAKGNQRARGENKPAEFAYQNPGLWPLDDKGQYRSKKEGETKRRRTIG